MTEYTIPDLSLVVLVGVSGSGKSTFARKHFLRTEVISSDTARGWVSDDEADQSATPDAFDVVDYIAAKRLDRGRLTVVDATSVQSADRKKLIDLARAHNVLPVAIVLDVPSETCIERNKSRTDRDMPDRVVLRQANNLRRSLKHLSREGFRRVHILKGVDEIDSATVTREPLLTDRRTEHGPFDAIGDVHGCREELEALLTKLGYLLVRDEDGRPVDAAHPEGRRAIFLGDLVDRGPDSPGVVRLAMGMHASGNALVIPGNHENKLIRALRGRNVQLTHGLPETLEQLGAEPPEFRGQVLKFFDGLVAHLVLDDGKLVVAHAGLKESFHNRSSGRVRSFALYGDTTGETDEFGLPVRYPWANDYRGKAVVLYGHTPVPTAEWVNNTLCLDTGCVFGGSLTALRYPEREVVSVPAARVYYEPAKPLETPATPDDRAPQAVEGPAFSGDRGGGAPAGVDITDVLGRRTIETSDFGAITVREDNAAGALEVMSRFAIDPRWLLYLPPTMSPVATSKREGLLEHPDQAFAAYRSDGITKLICEEKHMGSRAVVLVCKDESVATRRFGSTDGSTGAIYTRTGRSFFDDDRTEQVLARVRAAAAGLWEELDAEWLLFDAELMPWSVKAGELLRRQYAAVGAAGRSALPAAVSALSMAMKRGVDAQDLFSRTAKRQENINAFVDAYRQYCWPTEGLTGLKLAPFQLLASNGATYLERDHLWHMEIAKRLAEKDSDLITTTNFQVVDLDQPETVQQATDWWTTMTATGGEGMVVKPLEGLVRKQGRLLQPGVKCRGPEYLRIIYGPDYTEPDNIARLRDRGLGRKRSLAIREYALGVESLNRAARDEPLWRIHECVFAVLALESEPVDPRL